MIAQPNTLRFMPAAMELIGGQGTAIGATLAALTPLTGDSFSVRNGNPGAEILLLQLWADVQVAGTMRVRSPRFHDNVQGIRFDTVIGDLKPLLPWGLPEPLLPQDNMTIELAGSAVAGDIEQVMALLYYADLGGSDARLESWESIAPRIEHIVTVENTIATGAAGNYSGSEAISAEFDLLKANTDYALLGYVVDTECAAVAWRGSDTGNYRVGGPGEPDLRDITKDWFVLLSQAYGLPCIPVFNAGNKAAITVEAVQDENGADPTVTSIFAQLS
jgi:hypothetical protein